MKRSIKAVMTAAAAVLLCAVLASAVFADGSGFTDTKPGAWYEKALTYVVKHDIMAGTSETTFAPQATFSRAMAALVSARIAGADLSGYGKGESGFTDVDSGRWYAAAVEWANEKGIAVGYGTTFRPNAPVTREQLALMMMNLSSLAGLSNYDEEPADMTSFSDADTISAWAAEAVEWAVSNGYISGYDDHTVRPRGNATRAQAAQIFYNLNYVKEFGNLPPDTSYVESLAAVKESDEVRILCWGDSLTEGCFYVPAEGENGAYNIIDVENAYPTQLAGMTGLTVINYGISGETAEQIAERQGGLPVYVDKLTIPADCTPVRIYLMLENGDETEFMTAGLKYHDEKINIAGVWGDLSIEKHAEDPADNGYYFTRCEPGEEVTTHRITQIVTEQMADMRSKDILVIFTGSNNRINPYILPDVIELQEAMIDFADARDRYVVIDFTAQPMIGEIFRVNEMMLEHYGDRTVRIHHYFMTDALTDAGITPTDADLYNISIGQVPDSLLCRDHLHAMPIFNTLLAQQVKLKLTELGLLG